MCVSHLVRVPVQWQLQGWPPSRSGPLTQLAPAHMHQLSASFTASHQNIVRTARVAAHMHQLSVSFTASHKNIVRTARVAAHMHQLSASFTASHKNIVRTARVAAQAFKQGDLSVLPCLNAEGAVTTVQWRGSQGGDTADPSSSSTQNPLSRTGRGLTGAAAVGAVVAVPVRGLAAASVVSPLLAFWLPPNSPANWPARPPTKLLSWPFCLMTWLLISICSGAAACRRGHVVRQRAQHTNFSRMGRLSSSERLRQHHLNVQCSSCEKCHCKSLNYLQLSIVQATCRFRVPTARDIVSFGG